MNSSETSSSRETILLQQAELDGEIDARIYLAATGNCADASVREFARRVVLATRRIVAESAMYHTAPLTVRRALKSQLRTERSAKEEYAAERFARWLFRPRMHQVSNFRLGVLVAALLLLLIVVVCIRTQFLRDLFDRGSVVQPAVGRAVELSPNFPEGPFRA